MKPTLLCLALALPLPAVAQDPISVTLDRAAAEYAGDLHHQALETLLATAEQWASRLGTTSGAEAARLADELEVLLGYHGRIAGSIGAAQLSTEHAGRLDVDPEHGMVYARLAWMRGRVVEDLHPLLAWEFAGPFDNERGQGMTRVTPAGEDPTAATYAGKVRLVGWRSLPAVPPRHGIVRFTRLIDPADQVCVVARTWIRAEADQDVVLLLGAGEEVRVWFAGEDVHVALGAHTMAPDTWSIPLTLRAGWNELALQVGSMDAAPTFLARLVEPGSARPLAFASRPTAPEDTTPHALRPGSPTAPSTNPGAARRYAAGEEAESLFRKSLLMQQHQTAPRHERPGAAAIAAACALVEGNLRYDLLELSTLRVRGARREEEDVSPWLAALDRMLAEHDPSPMLMRTRAQHAWDVQPTYSRALEWLEAALTVAPHSVPARYDHARVLSLAGQGELAQAGLRALAARDALYGYPDLCMNVARSLPGTDPSRAALIAVPRAQGDDAAIDMARGMVARLASRSDAEDVLETLAEKLRHHPWSNSARREAAQQLLVRNEPALALKVLDEALEYCPERATLHRWRARALLSMGELESATTALETLLELDTSAEDDRRLLGHLQNLGGAPFHEPFLEPLADILVRRVRDGVVDAAVAPREVLLSRLVIEVQPDGTAKRYRRQVERVLSEAGARDLDRRVFRAWPGEEEIRVLDADVQRTSGAVDAAQTGRTGGRGVVVVDLPPLVPGDVVDLQWRHDTLRTSHFGNYFGMDAPFSPDETLPVRESEIVLIVPASFPLTLHPRLPEGADYETSVRADGATVHRWRASGLEPRRLEHLQPPSMESAPRVQASSYASWTDFGRWWWNLIEDEVRVSDEMAEKVAQLTAGKETRLEKLRAVYDFVVTEVRYNAWEFGVHGYQPYSAPVIFSRRFGDCKDKAILLKALLSEVDIEAWPVLIRMEPRRYEEDHALALVQHFNHCIAYVPAQDGLPEMFLDGTARLHPLGVLPDSDAGAKVVIVRDDGVQSARIGFPMPHFNALDDTIVVDLSGPDGARVSMTRRPTGRWDPQHRHLLTGNPEERAEKVESLLTSTFGALRGTPTLDGSDYEDLTQPLELVFEAGVEDLTRPAAGGFELPTSFEPFELLRSVASETERETDLLLDVPWSRKTQIDYKLGEGSKPVDLPPPVKVELLDGSYTRTVEVTPDGVRVTEEFQLRTHRVPLDRYQEFRELCRTIDISQDAAVRVEVAQ